MDSNINKIKLLITIVDRGKGQDVIDIYKNENLIFNFICLGHGTSSSEIIDYLGLGENEKDIVFSIISFYDEKKILDNLNKKLNLNKHGMGISFSIQLNSINSIISKKLTSKAHCDIEEEVDIKMDEERGYGLVITVVNRGYSEDVMEAAKRYGATGGTIVHARGCGIDELEKFMGIIIQPEKEIVLVLVSNKIKHEVMNGINNAVGLNKDGRGICFSIPVDKVNGLSALNKPKI